MHKSFVVKSTVIFFALVLIISLLLGANFYTKVYRSNSLQDGYLFIPTGSVFNDVIENLENENLIKDINSFVWLAKKKNYQNHVYAGRYKIDSSMNNNNIINKLRSGHQDPVKVIFNSVRTREQLAGKIASQIEADSASLVKSFYNDSIINDFNLKQETISCIFLPNTYEFWWNSSANTFMNKMYSEYKRFWNDDRLKKANKLNLTKEDVITLASIVDEETLYNVEMPRVAGLYINRLRRRMYLQADPTLKFAIGDFTIKRVLNVHKQIDSPYNTYKKYGLPPGPISIPSISAIDAVLNFESHKYIYMCAKPDFSGYHNFAKSLSQHNINARNYQRALNKERIWR
jgi:UPF0755 protein